MIDVGLEGNRVLPVPYDLWTLQRCDLDMVKGSKSVSGSGFSLVQTWFITFGPTLKPGTGL